MRFDNSMKTSIRRIRQGTGALICALIIAALPGCSYEPPREFRVGINAWPGYEFLYLAQEKGFYRDERLDVRILEFSSLSDARRAYERGQIDAFGTTVIEVLQAREHSARSPQVVQVVDYSNGADMVLTQPGITTSAGLRGKRIGVELGSLGIYILARCLAKHGLTIEDVVPVSSDQTSMESSFARGDLEAIVTYPPTTVNLLKSGKAHIFFTTAEIPSEVIDVIAVEESFVRTRGAEVAKLIRAFHRAVSYTQKNPDDAFAIMAAREGLTPGEFRTALTDGIRLVPASEQTDYLRPGGRLAAIIDTSDRVLRQCGQITGPDRRANSFNPLFTGIEGTGR